MSKEATVYVLDLGATMGDCHSGRVETDLHYAMRYVYDKMADNMSSARTTISTGVVAFRTDETSNPCDADEGYENINVLKPLGPLTMPVFNELRNKIVPSQTEAGDAISGVVVALEMIKQFTTLKSGKPGKFDRNIVLVTDGQGTIDDELLDDIAQRVKHLEVRLTVMGVDFDDLDFGFKEEDKSSIKKDNEKLLRDFVEKCGEEAMFATVAEVISTLSTPRVKPVRVIPNYEGKLCLGDPEKYPETAVSIDVKRYYKTKLAKPVSAKSITVPTGAASTQSSHTFPDDVEMTDAPSHDFAGVKTERIYEVKDPENPGVKKKVERDDLAKGFQYGRSAVPVNESDENVTKLETIKSFTIIGFVPTDKYEQYFTMGESCITIAQTVNDRARLALSSLIHAIHELDSYAVARLVQKDGKDPQILLLAPFVETNIEGLIDVPLPFAEDFRRFRFPPLDRVITTSGATVDKHRYLPSTDLDTAMSEYVDSMDLSTFDKDEGGQPSEYMTIDETFSPAVHRINQAIRHRAIYDGPVQPAAEVLTKWSQPPAELVAKTASHIRKLIAAADVKKVPPKVKGKRGRQEAAKPLSGLDIESLLVKHKPKNISKENAIPEFRQILASADADEIVFNALDDMAEIAWGFLQVLGDTEHQRAQENIRVMREEMIDLEFPEKYNDFFRDLKQRIVKKEFGNRREFWQNLKHEKLGLIDTDTHPDSEVTPEEAKQFWSMATELPTRTRED